MQMARRVAQDEFHGNTGWIESVADVQGMDLEERLSVGKEDEGDIPRAIDHSEMIYGEYPPCMKPKASDRPQWATQSQEDTDRGNRQKAKHDDDHSYKCDRCGKEGKWGVTAWHRVGSKRQKDALVCR